jgi:hypothetical protein
VLIVDPPFKKELLNEARRVPEVRASKYRDNLFDLPNYPHFSEKFDIAEESSSFNPTMNSVFDDVVSYYQGTNVDVGNDPIDCTLFVRQLVICKCVADLNHIKWCWLSTSMGFVLSGSPLHGPLHFSPIWAPTWTESLFNQLMQWQSDIRLRRTKVAMNMRRLGIDPDNPGSHGMVDEKEASEWRYIYNTLQEYNDSFASMTNYYTQIMGVRESQRSNLQARYAGQLTVLGTLFVPVSIITGILSMGGEFLPGERRFWVFFAIVIPILLVICLCLFTNIIPWAQRRLKSLGTKALPRNI